MKYQANKVTDIQIAYIGVDIYDRFGFGRPD